MCRYYRQLFQGGWEVKQAIEEDCRGIAQFGSAPALGAGCREFESLYPDQFGACSSTG